MSKGPATVFTAIYLQVWGVLFLLSYFLPGRSYLLKGLMWLCENTSRPRGRWTAILWGVFAILFAGYFLLIVTRSRVSLGSQVQAAEVKLVFLVQTAQAMRASLLARATAARLLPRRCRTAVAQRRSRSGRVETIASGRGVRVRSRLVRQFGRGNWRKRKGFARIRLENGRVIEAELHSYEAHGIGKRGMKIKRYLKL